MSTIVVRATWDPETSYWLVESLDVPGLSTGAATLNELAAKLPGIIQDLLESADSSDLTETEIPVEIIAHLDKGTRPRRRMKDPAQSIHATTMRSAKINADVFTEAARPLKLEHNDSFCRPHSL